MSNTIISPGKSCIVELLMLLGISIYSSKVIPSHHPHHAQRLRCSDDRALTNSHMAHFDPSGLIQRITHPLDDQPEIAFCIVVSVETHRILWIIRPLRGIRVEELELVQVLVRIHALKDNESIAVYFFNVLFDFLS
jgi:hypothetical protein